MEEPEDDGSKDPGDILDNTGNDGLAHFFAKELDAGYAITMD